jgi:hypothetical protein
MMYVDCRIMTCSLRLMLHRTGLGASRGLEKSDVNVFDITMLENGLLF